jgi:predicted nucleic acid-binding protein
VLVDALPRRPLSAVLDACVLFPFYLRDFLLSTAFHGHLFVPRWSREIFDELARNLVEDQRLSRDQSTRLLQAMSVAFPHAEFSGGGRLIPCLTNHPKDRHVVETALVTRSECIVTVNECDFRSADLDPLGLECLTPDAFLGRMYEGHEDLLPLVLHQQLRRYHRQPLSPSELVQILARSVPRMVRLLPAEW